ncbi:hypothetical protein B7P43_G08317 [Cryptotermes secundus]|uniref:Uncharacterized protein n=1 Tax=Cryptotermes secundus TaxID=105785 RepID=A0A2J7QH61_9NEOP|nr:hypothetical protein B7P43_G08317 [Cryptotermes secundus]
MSTLFTILEKILYILNPRKLTLFLSSGLHIGEIHFKISVCDCVMNMRPVLQVLALQAWEPQMVQQILSML